MLSFPAIGSWLPGEIQISWIRSTRPMVPRVEQLIDRAWNEASQRPGINLFDGPMCRLEQLQIRKHLMHLTLSRTSYRPFMGTNLTHAELADTYGPEVLANPIGLSALVVSSDRFLMMGRRNQSVAYYPDHVHPFSGALEPRDDLDVFGDIRRELSEELALSDKDIEQITCGGMAMDLSIRQPEMIFIVKVNRARGQIESQLDREEHRGTWSAETSREAVKQALASGEQFTPVGIAALLLWGRVEFGSAWFESSRAQAALKGSQPDR
jgi:hypothetical protein